MSDNGAPSIDLHVEPIDAVSLVRGDDLAHLGKAGYWHIQSSSPDMDFVSRQDRLTKIHSKFVNFKILRFSMLACSGLWCYRNGNIVNWITGTQLLSIPSQLGLLGVKTIVTTLFESSHANTR